MSSERRLARHSGAQARFVPPYKKLMLQSPEDAERQPVDERIPLHQIPRVLELLDALKDKLRAARYDARIDYRYVPMDWCLTVDGREVARAATAEDLAKAGLQWLANRGGEGQQEGQAPLTT